MKGYVAFGSMLLAFQAARTNRGINPILFKYKAAIALIVFVCWRLLRNSRSSSNHIEAIEVAIKKNGNQDILTQFWPRLVAKLMIQRAL